MTEETRPADQATKGDRPDVLERLDEATDAVERSRTAAATDDALVDVDE
ncbi:hypothetical protein [Lentzea cavernae]|uniref:Uncharacterized protein n=1 Tax=Lentzea cavernae TaxID=2020703 RepID=A0ABQ3MFF1_9PSEU|nr:hypothetical protein [Lentzea cavernae]GHH43871.1 hypothetical protein GCM10017774_42230 [Lentzea cavernae]